MPKLAKIIEKRRRRHMRRFLGRLKKNGTTSLPFLINADHNNNKHVSTLGDIVGFSRLIPPVKVDQEYLARLEASSLALDDDITRLFGNDDPVFNIRSCLTAISPWNQTPINYNDLRTLGDLNIDTSFLDYFEKEDEGDETDILLRQNGVLLMALEKEQNKRLARGATLPTVREQKLADKLVERLADLSQSAGPGQLVSEMALHQAMGINI